MRLSILFEGADLASTGLPVKPEVLEKDFYGVEWHAIDPIQYRIDQRTQTVHALTAIARSAAEWWVRTIEYGIANTAGRVEITVKRRGQTPLEDIPTEQTTADVVKPGPGRVYIS